jgi:hypothetical protein
VTNSIGAGRLARDFNLVHYEPLADWQWGEWLVATVRARWTTQAGLHFDYTLEARSNRLALSPVWGPFSLAVSLTLSGIRLGDTASCHSTVGLLAGSLGCGLRRLGTRDLVSLGPLTDNVFQSFARSLVRSSVCTLLRSRRSLQVQL